MLTLLGTETLIQNQFSFIKKYWKQMIFHDLFSLTCIFKQKEHITKIQFSTPLLGRYYMPQTFLNLIFWCISNQQLIFLLNAKTCLQCNKCSLIKKHDTYDQLFLVNHSWIIQSYSNDLTQSSKCKLLSVLNFQIFPPQKYFKNPQNC